MTQRDFARHGAATLGGVPLVHYDCGLDLPETTAYTDDLGDRLGDLVGDLGVVGDMAPAWPPEGGAYQPIRTGDALAEMVAAAGWEHGTDGDPAALGRWWQAVCQGPAGEAPTAAATVPSSSGGYAPTSHRPAPGRSARGAAPGCAPAAPSPARRCGRGRRSTCGAYLHHHGVPANPVYAMS